MDSFNPYLTAVKPFPVQLTPMNQITPFTYRDGMTYLKYLEYLRQWIEQEIVGGFNETLEKLFTDFQGAIKNAEDTIINKTAEWDALFQQFMADIVVQLETLNDQAVANLVNNPASKLAQSLAKFQTVQSFNDFKVILDGELESIDDSLVELEDNKVNKSDHFAVVTEFGAINDGVADCTNAVRSAMNSLSENGGTLYFPPGEYYMSDYVDLVSNLTIFGSGATLRKLKSTDPSYIFFRGPSNGRVGYASGGVNVNIHDLTFRGNFLAGGRGGCAVATNHWSDIVVRDCVFTELHGQGHIFDLGAAENVLIENSIFEGSNRGFAGNNSNSEYIQFDVSNVNALSFPDAPGSCDGLGSRNIHVNNCIFRPLVVGGMEYGTGSPFGNHSVSEGYPHENVKFTNNTVIDPLDAPVPNFKGVLHFTGVKGIAVTGNKFINTKHVDNNCIAIYNGAGGYSAAKSNSVDNPYYNFTTPIAPSNVDIIKNEFIGWSSVLGNSDSIIRINGNNGFLASNIDVSDNVFTDCSPVGYTGSAAQICASIGYGDVVKFNRNTGTNIGRFAKINNSKNVFSVENVIDTTSNIPLTFSDSNIVVIDGNSVSNYSQDAININNVTPVKNIVVINNNLKNGKTVERNAIIANTTSDSVFSGNNISNTVNMARGIYVWGIGSDNIAIANIIKGVTETIVGASITKTANIPV